MIFNKVFKTIASLALILVIIPSSMLSIFSMPVLAWDSYDEDDGNPWERGFCYGYWDDEITCTVIGHDGKSSILNIPERLGGRPVIAIDSLAFGEDVDGREWTASGRGNYIKEVVIPKTVDYIYYAAFANCENLNKVTFADGSNLREIKRYAFWYCQIGDLILPRKLETIGDYAFEYCKNLKLVFESNSGLKSIGQCAFKDCRSIENLDLPYGLETLGSFAFENCTGLKSVTIPQTVTKFGASVFEGCKNLETIYVNYENQQPDYSELFPGKTIVYEQKNRGSVISEGWVSTEDQEKARIASQPKKKKGWFGWGILWFDSELKVDGESNSLQLYENVVLDENRKKVNEAGLAGNEEINTALTNILLQMKPKAECYVIEVNNPQTEPVPIEMGDYYDDKVAKIDFISMNGNVITKDGSIIKNEELATNQKDLTYQEVLLDKSRVISFKEINHPMYIVIGFEDQKDED